MREGLVLVRAIRTELKRRAAGQSHSHEPQNGFGVNGSFLVRKCDRRAIELGGLGELRRRSCVQAELIENGNFYRFHASVPSGTLPMREEIPACAAPSASVMT